MTPLPPSRMPLRRHLLSYTARRLPISARMTPPRDDSALLQVQFFVQGQFLCEGTTTPLGWRFYTGRASAADCAATGGGSPRDLGYLDAPRHLGLLTTEVNGGLRAKILLVLPDDGTPEEALAGQPDETLLTEEAPIAADEFDEGWQAAPAPARPRRQATGRDTDPPDTRPDGAAEAAEEMTAMGDVSGHASDAMGPAFLQDRDPGDEDDADEATVLNVELVVLACFEIPPGARLHPDDLWLESRAALHLLVYGTSETPDEASVQAFLDSL